jgi:hypothetical protein
MKISTKRPDLEKDDVHVLINDFEHRFVGEAKCYAPDGTVLWTVPSLGKGVDGPRTDVRGGDTPAGLYIAGTIYETRETEPWHIWASYGKWCVDMEEQQNQEASVGRAGICLHGGGSGLPDPLAPKQPLVATFGCVRMHNQDLDKIVIPCLKSVRAKGGTMWITVNQLP